MPFFEVCVFWGIAIFCLFPAIVSNMERCKPLLPSSTRKGALAEYFREGWQRVFFLKINRSSYSTFVHFYNHVEKKLSFGCSCEYFTRKWPCERFSFLLEPDSLQTVLLVKIALGSHQHVLISYSAVLWGIS